MPTISTPLQMHVYLCGNYAHANTQRRAWKRETRGTPDGTQQDTLTRGLLHKAVANVAAQEKWAQPFTQMLGNGAQPGVVRDFASLVAGETNGELWADARANSVAHPCKTEPSLANVLRAGLAGVGAGFMPGVVLGCLAGSLLAAGTALVATVTGGMVGAGVHTGMVVLLKCTAAISLGAGIIAMIAAYSILDARLNGNRERSRLWEDVSGYIALIPRVVVALAFEPDLVLNLSNATQL